MCSSAFAVEPTELVPKEQAEAAMGDVLAQDSRLRFSSFESLLSVDDVPARLAEEQRLQRQRTGIILIGGK
jgi:hypothetical protein